MGSSLETIAKVICAEYNMSYVKKVGEGSFKETFKVYSNEGIVGALKVFKASNSAERSSREIDAMLRCDHPNIGKIRFMDNYNYNGKNNLFTIEEFFSGGTLGEHLKKNGDLSKKDTVRLGLLLIDAIKHIASKDLVHRDIKPENVMFSTDISHPVIVDFGLVRDLSNKSLTQTWLMSGPGTPFYSAPEQLNNEKNLIDWRTDQYALGVLLSLSLFGIHPYAKQGDNMAQVVIRVARRDSVNSDFKQAVKNNGVSPLSKMVKQWPVERYRNIEELYHEWEKVE